MAFEPILSVKSWQSGWNFLMEGVGWNPSYCQIALPRVDSLVSPRHDEEAGSAGWHYPQISVYGFIGAAAASRLLSLLMSPLFLFFSNLLSSISFFLLSVCSLLLRLHCYCGFWSNRTLLYFPLSSVRSSVRPSQA